MYNCLKRTHRFIGLWQWSSLINELQFMGQTHPTLKAKEGEGERGGFLLLIYWSQKISSFCGIVKIGHHMATLNSFFVFFFNAFGLLTFFFSLTHGQFGVCIVCQFRWLSFGGKRFELLVEINSLIFKWKESNFHSLWVILLC